ncbi:hypothetical protein OXX79_005276 [Metschnikowia pulcherrima]
MGLIAESEATSVEALLRENSEASLAILKKQLQGQGDIDDENLRFIKTTLTRNLEISKFDWKWLENAPSDRVLELQLEIAVSCIDLCPDDLMLSLILAVSYYTNAHVPWSNQQLAEISSAANTQKSRVYLARFADSILSQFLSVSGQTFTTVSSRRKGKKHFAKSRVSRPALGLQISSLTEDNERTGWKQSSSVAALSSAVFLMMCDESNEYAAKCSTFALNVLDDPDPLFRAQGCFLVMQMLKHGYGLFLVRAGLIPVFLESVKTCLTYLPQLTPANVSFFLLKGAAYPALLALLGISENSSYVTYLEVLDGNLLASISHVSGRNSDAETNSLLAFFFIQTTALIEQNLRLSVLACFSRLNFVLCQTITNPYLIESENGDQVVTAALKVQNAIFSLCSEHEDRQPSKLILQYRLDFLAAWAILGKRIVNYGVGSAENKQVLQSNVSSLKKLAGKAGVESVQEDLYALWDKAPELRELVQTSE